MPTDFRLPTTDHRSSDLRVVRRLDAVIADLAAVRRFRRQTAFWIFMAAATAAAVALGWLPGTWPVAIGVAAACLIVSLFVRGGRADDVSRTAQLVEQRYPDLDAGLLTAVHQHPDPRTGEYGFLQRQVFSDVFAHARNTHWRSAGPAKKLWWWRACRVAAMALFVAAFQLAARYQPQVSSIVAGVAGPAARSGAQPTVTVEPGDVELERGASLLVFARFSDPVPRSADLITRDGDGNERRQPLSRSLKDPVFGGRVAGVPGDLTYRVEYDGGRSTDFRVTTFIYPDLEQADALIIPPAYTNLPEQKLEDVRRVSLVESSTLTLTCRLNKPVATAVLVSADGQSLPLSIAPPTDPAAADRTLAVTWQPAASGKLSLVLTDDAGRANREPPEFVIDLSANRPPELKVAFPARDTQVSPLEEMQLAAEAWDDFGLSGYGLVVQQPDGAERTIPLGESSPAEANVGMEHLLALELLGPQPRDLVSYYFYADDVGPDGASRRTFSDIFFAEVRHFEEIYQQQPGQAGQQQQQQSPQGTQAQQLAELQRQIVTALWNMIRNWPRDPGPVTRDKFLSDVDTVAGTQGVAAAQAQELAAELADAEAQAHAADAQRHMGDVERELQAASESAAIKSLPPARAAAQAAYQSILRLQSRLHIVQQQQQQNSQSQSAGGAARNMDRQLDQLALDDQRNRYEQERQAANPEQDAAQREDNQVLSRLRELAQRQEDLNERIKEMEQKLRDAPEAEREEVERELKRLQEEQEQLLRDADELHERMEQPENQRSMAEQRQQLEETRENLRRSSEALEQGQTSKALASGTRASRELEDLREEFRRRTAGDFDDIMRELRDDATRLAEREREIGEQLAGDKPADDRPTLRDTDNREAIGEAIEQQQQDLQELLDRMRDTVEQSETSEPLLSKKLYESMRQARVDQPEEALEMTHELLRRGFPAESAEAEQQARRGIEQLRSGVEEAADSVLGDETEALARARDELNELSDAIRSELQQAGAVPAQGANGEQPDGQSSHEPNAQASFPGESARGEAQSPPGTNQPPAIREEPADPNGRRPGATRSDDPNQRDPTSPPSPSGAGDPVPPSADSPPATPPADSPTSQGQSENPQAPGESQERPTPGRGNQGSAQPGESATPPSGDPSAGERDGQPGRRRPSLTDALRGTADPAGTGGGGDGFERPLSGQDFSNWSDRMRDVEEMLADPELRGEVSTVRERARDVRREAHRHSEAPNWELVRTSIYGPLIELQARLDEELLRRSPQQSLVPIDRDPVPDRYRELVRRYYEELGRSR